MSAEPLIAIVDDDPSALDAMAALARALGFGVVAYSSAEDFIASGDARRIACLVADVQMPGMTGLELCAALAADGLAVPTVLVSAHSSDVVERQAYRAGARWYLAKPFRPDDLVACIRAACGA